MSEEQTPAGSPVYRHEQAAPLDGDGEAAHADDERLTAHLTRYHGGKLDVWHEVVSSRVHLDVHVAHPTPEHPFFLLLTSGMSARPMHVPDDLPDRERWTHAELCIVLPPDWTPSAEAFQDPRVFWPVRLVKTLARIPHDYSSWLGYGHSIPNGDPARPYAPGTELCGAVLVAPELLGEEFFEVPGEPPLHIFQVVPVTEAEMEVKLQRGLDGLLERLEGAFDPYGPVDAGRPSAV